MKRIDILGILLAACSSKAAPPVTTTTTTSPAADAHCPIARDPHEIGFTVGNQWTYAVYRPWHTSLNNVPVEVTVTVAKVEQVGRYRVAWLTWPDKEQIPDGSVPSARVADGARVYLLMEDVSHDEAAITDALSTAVVERGGASGERVSCQGAYCGVSRGRTTSSGIGPDSEGWATDATSEVVDGLGTVWATEGGYSPDTGDGGTDHLVLVGWKLAAAPARPARGPEPPAARALRERLHTAATRRDLAAVLAATDADIELAAIEGARGKELAAAAWKADDGTALAALAQATARPCAALTPRAVVCPADAGVVACESSGPTPPRAVLEQRTGGWVLTRLYAGGRDDLYTSAASDDGPLQPLRKVAR